MNLAINFRFTEKKGDFEQLIKCIEVFKRDLKMIPPETQLRIKRIVIKNNIKLPSGLL